MTETRLKSPPVAKHEIGDQLRGIAKKQGKGMGRVIVGIADDQAKKATEANESFTYIDHSYFQRGWGWGNFRCIRNGVHLTTPLDRPSDRLKRFGVEIHPWRKTGREIVIIPLSERQQEFYGAHEWLIQTESRLAEITDRPVVVKNRKSTRMEDFCRDAWAVVTYASVAGVEAALMGIPVFATEHCPSWPVNAGRLEDIETPAYSERLEWASSLSYACWNTSELRKIRWGDYDYSIEENEIYEA